MLHFLSKKKSRENLKACFFFSSQLTWQCLTKRFNFRKLTRTSRLFFSSCSLFLSWTRMSYVYMSLSPTFSKKYCHMYLAFLCRFSSWEIRDNEGFMSWIWSAFLHIYFSVLKIGSNPLRAWAAKFRKLMSIRFFWPMLFFLFCRCQNSYFGIPVAPKLEHWCIGYSSFFMGKVHLPIRWSCFRVRIFIHQRAWVLFSWAFCVFLVFQSFRKQTSSGSSQLSIS